MSPRLPVTLALGLCLGGCGDGSGAGENGDAQANQSGCLDSRTAVTVDEVLPLGFSAAQVLAFTEGQREADLRWPAGGTTRVRHLLQAPSLFFVRSQHDPDYQLNRAVQCRDHLLVEGAVVLTTTDGQLDERWPVGRFRSFDGQRAVGTVSAKTAAIRGAYQSGLGNNQCLLGLQFDVTFAAATGFSGKILQTVANSSCASLGDHTAVSPLNGGAWGG